MDKFLFDLQRFADGGEPNTGADGGSGDGDQGNAGGKKIEFTPEQQAHIDALVAQRLSRAEKSAQRKALEARAKDLGYESVADMEAALEAHRKAQDAQKTEAEKLRESLEAEKAKVADAQAKARAALIKAAFVAEAATANLVSVDDAFKLADLSEVDVSEDGTVTGIKEAVEQLVKEKPYLVKQGQGAGTGGAPFRGGPAQDNDAERARQIALERNRQSQGGGGFDPWATGGSNQADHIAQAVAAAVSAALQGQGR